MNEAYSEWLVKRKPPVYAIAVKAVMIVLCIFSVFLALTTVLGVIALLVVGGISYFVFQNMNLEYEYLYVNGELDVDKIMSKTKRKRVASIEMEKVELVAPLKSHELDYYRNNKGIKIVDYSSGEEDHDIYAIILNGEKGMQMIYFEPNNIILKDMRRIAPRKVKTM